MRPKRRRSKRATVPRRPEAPYGLTRTLHWDHTSSRPFVIKLHSALQVDQITTPRGRPDNSAHLLGQGALRRSPGGVFHRTLFRCNDAPYVVNFKLSPGAGRTIKGYCNESQKAGRERQRSMGDDTADM